ncbi:MAG: alpha/beta fold hydrolase [Candidatus Binatia bacterium]
MTVICSGALLLVVAIVCGNAAAYAHRAAILKGATGCDAVEPLGIISAAGAFATECAALAAVLCLIPIGWCTPRCRSSAPARGTLVLVHGWGLNRGCFWRLRRRLLRDGWGPVVCFEYRSFAANVERAAEALRPVVERLASAIPGRPITLIGHSLGGLVIRYYVRRYPASGVRRVVTLGTPHAGTVLPACRVGPAARRVMPESPLLKTLNAADRVPQQFDVIAIHSTFDALVLPPSNAEYPGAFNIRLNDVGHNALLFSSKVYRLLAENLAAPLR